MRSVWQCFMLWFTLFPLSPVARVVGSIRVPAFLLGIQACWPTPSSFSLALTSSSRERRAVLAFREPTFFFLRFYLFERDSIYELGDGQRVRERESQADSA